MVYVSGIWRVIAQCILLPFLQLLNLNNYVSFLRVSRLENAF